MKNFFPFFKKNFIGEKFIPPATGSARFYPIVSWLSFNSTFTTRSPHD